MIDLPKYEKQQLYFNTYPCYTYSNTILSPFTLKTNIHTTFYTGVRFRTILSGIGHLTSY